MSTGYLLRRLGVAVPTAAGIVVVAFLVIHAAPGDPVLALAGEYGDPGYYAVMRAKLGLDRPLPAQLLAYTAHVLRGDFGFSYVHGRPVTAVIVERLPATVLLLATALVLSTGLGLALGVLAAVRAGRLADMALRVAALLGHATPAFWLAQLALLSLAVGAGLFPVQGMTDARRGSAGLPAFLDVLHHLALPAVVLAGGELALMTRLVRTGLLETLRADYVRTAEAKGLPAGRVLHHALRNGLLPVVTVVGGRVGMLASGAVLVEAVFGWPGIGRLLLASVQARDYPVLLGLFLLVSFAVIVANLITDLVYAWLDPRVRYD